MQFSLRLYAIAAFVVVQLAIANAVPANRTNGVHANGSSNAVPAKGTSGLCAPLSKGAATSLSPPSGTLWASFVGKGVQIYACPSGTLNAAKASIYTGCPGSPSPAGSHDFKAGDPHFFFKAKGQTKEFQGTVAQKQSSTTGIADAVLKTVNLNPNTGDIIAVLRSNTIGGNFDAKACKAGQSRAQIPYQAEYRVFIK